jgi:hypothetical protein
LILCNYTSVVTSEELVFPTVADVTAWFSDTAFCKYQN